jgi:hypothetical protein
MASRARNPSATGQRRARVIASLNAVPACRALGCAPLGEVVRQQGLAFVPMRWTPAGAR